MSICTTRLDLERERDLKPLRGCGRTGFQLDSSGSSRGIWLKALRRDHPFNR